jgi:Protein of unknown function (DUF3035)
MRGRELGRAAMLGSVLLLVAGCDTTVQESLGLSRRSPDEFQVVRRAPLIIPPDSTLRPPQPGSVSTVQPDPSREARSILTGDETPSVGGTLSPGEQALLQASPVAAEPDIRNRIVAENGELAQLDRRTFLYILSFQQKQFEPQDEVLNPSAEAARLRSGTGSVVTARTSSTPLPAP